jgi:hypothetical protein
VPGHEHTALYKRIGEIGTVAQFIRWFDDVRGTQSGTTDQSSSAGPAR